MLKNFILGLPSILQYIVIFGIVMLVLFVCLTLTRLIGKDRGKKQYYDDPEVCDKSVPDLFASTAFRRKGAKRGDDSEDKASGESDEGSAGDKE